MHREAVLASGEARDGALAASGQDDGGTLPLLGPRGWVAGDGGRAERGELAVALGEAVIGETELAVAFDDAALLEEVEDADAGGVQEICDVPSS